MPARPRRYKNLDKHNNRNTSKKTSNNNKTSKKTPRKKNNSKKKISTLPKNVWRNKKLLPRGYKRKNRDTFVITPPARIVTTLNSYFLMKSTNAPEFRRRFQYYRNCFGTENKVFLFVDACGGNQHPSVKDLVDAAIMTSTDGHGDVLCVDVLQPKHNKRQGKRKTTEAATLQTSATPQTSILNGHSTPQPSAPTLAPSKHIETTNSKQDGHVGGGKESGSKRTIGPTTFMTTLSTSDELLAISHRHARASSKNGNKCSGAQPPQVSDLKVRKHGGGSLQKVTCPCCNKVIGIARSEKAIIYLYPEGHSKYENTVSKPVAAGIYLVVHIYQNHTAGDYSNSSTLGSSYNATTYQGWVDLVHRHVIFHNHKIRQLFYELEVALLVHKRSVQFTSIIDAKFDQQKPNGKHCIHALLGFSTKGILHSVRASLQQRTNGFNRHPFINDEETRTLYNSGCEHMHGEGGTYEGTADSLDWITGQALVKKVFQAGFLPRFIMDDDGAMENILKLSWMQQCLHNVLPEAVQLDYPEQLPEKNPLTTAADVNCSPESVIATGTETFEDTRSMHLQKKRRKSKRETRNKNYRQKKSEIIQVSDARQMVGLNKTSREGMNKLHIFCRNHTLRAQIYNTIHKFHGKLNWNLKRLAKKSFANLTLAKYQIIMEVMKMNLDAALIEKGLSLQKNLVETLRKENNNMKEATAEEIKNKKKHSSSINKKGRNALYEFLRVQADDKTYAACMSALNTNKLSEASLSKENKKDIMNWFENTPSSKSKRLRLLLEELETKLTNQEIKSSRKKNESHTGSFTEYQHGSMTWYFVGNGIKWLVSCKTADADFNLEDGALEVYKQYSDHIVREGDCTQCNKAFHTNAKRIVAHLTNPLHIAVAQTCVLKVLIKYCDGVMTADGFTPVDNTPIEEYYAMVQLYISNGVAISSARWNLICSLAEARSQAHKARNLFMSTEWQWARQIFDKFGVNEKFDDLISILNSIGLPMDEVAQQKRFVKLAARDKKMERQATEEGKKLRKQFKMRNRVDDRAAKLQAAAAAKKESTAEFAKVLKEDIAEALGGREYDDQDPTAELLTLYGMELVAPSRASGLAKGSGKTAAASKSKSTGKKTAGEKRAGKKGAGKESAGKESAGKKSAGKKSAAVGESIGESNGIGRKRKSMCKGAVKKSGKSNGNKRKSRGKSAAGKSVQSTSNSDDDMTGQEILDAYPSVSEEESSSTASSDSDDDDVVFVSDNDEEGNDIITRLSPKRQKECIVSLLTLHLIARDGVCLYRTEALVTPEANVSGDDERVQNRQVIEMVKHAVEATREQTPTEVHINYGEKYFDGIQTSKASNDDLQMHQRCQGMSTYLGRYSNRGALNSKRVINMPPYAIWGSNDTMLNTLRYRVVKLQYKLPYPVIMCAIKVLSTLTPETKVSWLMMTREDATYGYGTRDLEVGEANAIPRLQKGVVSPEPLSMIETLQLCARISPDQPPRVAKYCRGPHYEAHVMSVQDWQRCVPLLNALGTLNGLKYEPRWKHVYNKIYKNGVEVLSRKKRKRKTTKPR